MGIFDQLHPEWQKRLADYEPLVTRIDSLIDKNDVTPAYENIFAAYQLPPDDIKGRNIWTRSIPDTWLCSRFSFFSLSTHATSSCVIEKYL